MTIAIQKKIEIPHMLQEAVKGGRAILFLGAGASKECKDVNGSTPPNAVQLRDILAEKYFGHKMARHDVMTVAEMAIDSGGGKSLVYETINEAFDGFETSEAHRMASEFHWRMIATTNYDTFVESAYSDSDRRAQTLVPFVKDDEPIDHRMQQASNSVQYLKLHGCLNHRNDPDIPLILSREAYASYSANRTRLFERLDFLAAECPIIFVGYGIGDSHIRNLIYRLEPKKRPRWYIVNPDLEVEEMKFWGTQNVEALKCTFAEFVEGLNAGVPPQKRVLSPSDEVLEFPLRQFFATTALESLQLRASIGADFTHVRSGMAFEQQLPKSFYSGFDTGWGGVVKRYDVTRKVGQDLLYKALLENENPSGPLFFLLQGPAGAGKTIALKRAALDAAVENNALVLWLEESGALRPDVFIELYELTGLPIYLFIDQVALHTDKILPLIKASTEKNIPVVVIGAERESDWTTYCSALNEKFPPQVLRIGNLSSREVNGLLDLLDTYDCLGLLKALSRSQQVEAFMDGDKADRQLLVALHELTQGKPFEDIVLAEHDSVNPEAARSLYLDIASMHQFSVKIRAGTISRISGISFLDYKENFLTPLKDIVKVEEDRYSHDYYYKTRHPHVAALVFRQVCADDASKAKQFKRLLGGLDAGYSTDLRVLGDICRGQALSRNFSEVEPVREIYELAMRVAPMQAFLHQQFAIFESSHTDGSMINAEKHAAGARELEPGNRTFIHTQAEVARKRANRETSAVLKQLLRRQTREFVGEMSSSDRFATATLCKLNVDETIELSGELSDDSKEHEDLFFADKLSRTEGTLKKAQQRFPDDAEILETEARLWQKLREQEKSLKALERAFRAGPRGTGTAIRIARIYDSKDRAKEAHDVLAETLKRLPHDKPSHLAMALHMLAQDEYNADVVKRHLNDSFSSDDQNFEARFILGQFLFAIGDIDGARLIFADISVRAPRDFRPTAPKADNDLTSRLPAHSGFIDGINTSYIFVRSGCYPSNLFAHISSIDPEMAESLEIGQEVEFRIRFNRKGPTAVDVKARGS